MKKIALVIILLGAHQAFGQQDKSMSMWSQSPMMYNAGSVATGEEDYSFFTNFRYQWFTVGNKPMRTNILNASFKIPDGFLGSNNFGIGINAVNDQTGDIGFMTTAVSVPINYTMALDRRNKLSVGVAPGYYQQGYDPTLQTWENQWTGGGFNPSINSCLLYTSPSPRDKRQSRMPSSA